MPQHLPNEYDGVIARQRRFKYDNLVRVISGFVRNICVKTWQYDHLYDEKGDRYIKSNRIRGVNFGRITAANKGI